MSLELPFGIKPVVNKANIDERYGPYNSIEEALIGTQGTRELGLSVGVIDSEKVVEYWFESDITDESLVIKSPPTPQQDRQIDYITLTDYSPSEDIQPGVGEVRIGNVIWKTANESFDDNGSGIYNVNNDPSTVDDFGLLYDKDAILRVVAANPGWRIPTWNDYLQLEEITNQVTEFSSQKIFEIGRGSSDNQSLWNVTVIWDNESGLSLVPCGYRLEDGTFATYRSMGLYWMDRVDSIQRYTGQTLNIDSNGLPRIIITKPHVIISGTNPVFTSAASLRLVKDI